MKLKNLLLAMMLLISFSCEKEESPVKSIDYVYNYLTHYDFYIYKYSSSAGAVSVSPEILIQFNDTCGYIVDNSHKFQWRLVDSGEYVKTDTSISCDAKISISGDFFENLPVYAHPLNLWIAFKYYQKLGESGSVIWTARGTESSVGTDTIIHSCGDEVYKYALKFK